MTSMIVIVATIFVVTVTIISVESIIVTTMTVITMKLVVVVSIIITTTRFIVPVVVVVTTVTIVTTTSFRTSIISWAPIIFKMTIIAVKSIAKRGTMIKTQLWTIFDFGEVWWRHRRTVRRLRPGAVSTTIFMVASTAISQQRKRPVFGVITPSWRRGWYRISGYHEDYAWGARHKFMAPGVVHNSLTHYSGYHPNHLVKDAFPRFRRK